jgi:hypothetical protein
MDQEGNNVDCSKFLVKCKVTTDDLGWFRRCAVEGILGILLALVGALHNTSNLVVTDALLEEVGLAGQGDVLHEVEGIGRVVNLDVAESEQQTVGDEFNVLAHEVGVHAKESAWQSIGQEFLLNLDGLNDNVADGLGRGLVLDLGEEEAGEVGVHALVAGDEFVGEGQTRHEAALLEPEHGCKGTTEKDALYSSERDETRREGRVLVRNPPHSPVGLLCDTWDWWHLLDLSCFVLIELYSLFSMALKRYARCFGSEMYVSINREYVSEWMFSIMIWKP